MGGNDSQEGGQSRFSHVDPIFWFCFALFNGRSVLSLLSERLNCQVGALEMPSERITT